MSVHEQTDRPKLRLQHRPVEIERKFLVSNGEWRRCAVGSVNIRDGLIAASEDRKVRVRISGDVATVVIKGPRSPGDATMMLMSATGGVGWRESLRPV